MLVFFVIGMGYLQIFLDVVGLCIKRMVEEYFMFYFYIFVEEIIFVIYEMDIGILQVNRNINGFFVIYILKNCIVFYFFFMLI